MGVRERKEGRGREREEGRERRRREDGRKALMTEGLSSPRIWSQSNSRNLGRDLCCNIQMFKCFFSGKHVFGSY